MDPLTMIDAEETRLLAQLAEVRAAKAVLRRVCGLTDPPHGPTGLPPDEPRGFVITPREAAATKEEPPPPHRPSVSAEAPPGKPAPRPSKGVPGKKAVRLLMVARHLLAAGPQHVRQMVKATNGEIGAQPHVNAAIRGHPWFRKTGTYLTDPWDLTEEGRAAVAAAGSAS